MDLDSADLRQAAQWLREARDVVVFTGAGVSAESGIATFRDPEGLWEEFPPEQFATWGGLVRTAVFHPRQLARFALAVIEPIAEAEPNAAHRAIAEMEGHARVTVVTQNIDGLHSLAGSSTVHEIHGSLWQIVTLRGRFVRRLGRGDLRKLVESLRRAARSRLSLGRLLSAIRPMFGLGVRGLHRPNVVMFGQAMAQPAWNLAQETAGACDLMICVGTSGTVMPAATLPDLARTAGAAVVTVDPECGGGDLWLRGPAAGVLPALVNEAFGQEGNDG